MLLSMIGIFTSFDYYTQIILDPLLSSSCNMFALRSFFLCYSLIASISFSFEFKMFLFSILRRSNKNFYGCNTCVVNFTLLFSVWAYFWGDAVSEAPFGDLPDLLTIRLFPLLNLETELKLDFNVALLLWFIMTVLPKSGISKLRS